MIAVAKCRPRPTRLLDHLFDDSLLNPDWVGNLFSHTANTPAGYPSVDVHEDDDTFILEADLPGLTKKDIDLQVDGNELTIASKKDEAKEDDKKVYLVRERRSASFSRKFTIPENVNKEGISADFKDGILSVILPKAPETKPKKN